MKGAKHVNRTVDTGEPPLIGIVPRHFLEDRAIMLYERYSHAVIAAGGAPLVLPLSENPLTYKTLLPVFDGFLMPGGQDIDPTLYGEEPEKGNDRYTPERDALEMRLLDFAYVHDVPLLAICRGMQMMNVFFGGTLYQDLNNLHGQPPADRRVPWGLDPERQRPQGRPATWSAETGCDYIEHWRADRYNQRVHMVDVRPASRLAGIVGCAPLATNSIHHQGVKDLGPGLVSDAIGPDGLIEAIEVPDRAFMLGVQWHPEFFPGDPAMSNFFTMLVNQARAYRRNRSNKAFRLSRIDT